MQSKTESKVIDILVGCGVVPREVDPVWWKLAPASSRRVHWALPFRA